MIAFCMLLGLGSFLFRHAAEARLSAWPAALLCVWIIASLAGSNSTARFHFPDRLRAACSRDSEADRGVRPARLRIIRWALITGPIVWWLPFLVVAFKAMFDLDIYRTFGYRFLYINGLASGVFLLYYSGYRRSSSGTSIIRSFFGRFFAISKATTSITR